MEKIWYPPLDLYRSNQTKASIWIWCNDQQFRDYEFLKGWQDHKDYSVRKQQNVTVKLLILWSSGVSNMNIDHGVIKRTITIKKVHIRIGKLIQPKSHNKIYIIVKGDSRLQMSMAAKIDVIGRISIKGMPSHWEDISIFY